MSVKKQFFNTLVKSILVIYSEISNLHDEGLTPSWDDPAVLARPRRRARPGRFAVAVTDSAASPRLRPRPLAQL